MHMQNLLIFHPPPAVPPVCGCWKDQSSTEPAGSEEASATVQLSAAAEVQQPDGSVKARPSVELDGGEGDAGRAGGENGRR